MWKTPLTSSKTSGAGPDLQPRISSAARSRRGSLPLSTIGGVSSVRLVDRERHREAVTSRPALLLVAWRGRPVTPARTA